MKTTIKIDMRSKEIEIFMGRKKVGVLEFIIENDKIMSTSIEIQEDFQRRGLGTLLVRALMGIADYFYKPIFLISNSNTTDFYKRLGFVCLREFKPEEGINVKYMTPRKYKGKEVVIKNLADRFYTGIEEVDLIWIPSKLERVEIYI